MKINYRILTLKTKDKEDLSLNYKIQILIQVVLITSINIIIQILVY